MAFGSALFAFLQVHQASLQNEAAQQESLVGLVTDIAQRIGTLQTTPPQRRNAITQALAAEAAQGLALVNTLHGHDLPAVDEYQL